MSDANLVDITRPGVLDGGWVAGDELWEIVEPLLRRFNAAGRIDWSAGIIDGSRIRALKGDLNGPSPVDRGRPGSKHHTIVDTIGPVAGKRDRPRKRPDALYSDRGCDYAKHRRLVRKRGVKPKVARRGQPHGSGLGKVRWVVERTFAWLHNMRRLRTRYERSGELHTAFLVLGRRRHLPTPTALACGRTTAFSNNL